MLRRLKKFLQQRVNVSNLLGNQKSATRFNRLDLQHFLPMEISVKLFNPSFSWGEVSTYELFCIDALVTAFKPTSIFEFGTFQGKTTLNMALNAPGATIHTLDLPYENFEVTKRTVQFEESLLLEGSRRQVGSFFKDKDTDITQIFCDSMLFDPTGFADSMDFIYIDGSHVYEYVRKDTENALVMLKKDSNR